MQRSLPYHLLKLVLLSSLLVSGCFHDRFADTYTRSQPREVDLAGVYILAEEEITGRPVGNLRAGNGVKASPNKLVLRADGTFAAVNFPEWACDVKDECSIHKFVSGRGQWRLEGSNDNAWFISFSSSMPSIDGVSAILSGEKPPYIIHLPVNDAYEGMVFRRQATPPMQK